MKFLCFSDSHGYTAPMRRALMMHPDADAVFFLGDGISDAVAVSADDRVAGVPRPWFFVRGNCDFSVNAAGLSLRKVEEISLGGVRIVLTHGDLYGVKSTDSHLAALGRERRADVVLFGHTHRPFERYVPDGDRPMYLFNPGSIMPDESRASSFGILTFAEGNILLSHGEINL